MGTPPTSTAGNKKKTVKRKGAAAGGDTGSMGSGTVLRQMRWTHALALGVGAIGAEVATTKFPVATTFFEKDGQPDSGIDIRWPIAAGVLGFGYWKGFGKVNPFLTATALGVGLSWAIDRIVAMATKSPVAAPAAPTAEGIYIGQIEDDSGAIGLARRLNRTEGTLTGLRRGAVEDRLQARLERRSAAGKALTPQQRRFLAQEQREDASQSRRIAGPPAFAPRGGAAQAMVRVPISAVKPAFLANMA